MEEKRLVIPSRAWWRERDVMGCNAIRRPQLPSLPRFPARVHVLFVPPVSQWELRASFATERTTALLCRPPVSLCRVGEVAGCYAVRKTHSSYLEARPGKGSGNIVVMTQFGVQGAGPATHAPFCQPDTCPMPTQAHSRHPSSWHLPLPRLWPPVRITAALSGIPPCPVATGLSPTPPSLPIRLQVC